MKMTREDRETLRRDKHGDLTLWGARDVIREMIIHMLSVVVPTLHEPFVRGIVDGVRDDASGVDLARALDDFEDAAVRTHEAFGCVVTMPNWDDHARARFTCRACRESRELHKTIDAEVRPDLE